MCSENSENRSHKGRAGNSIGNTMYSEGSEDRFSVKEVNTLRKWVRKGKKKKRGII